jgi:hypothetical protein
MELGYHGDQDVVDKSQEKFRAWMDNDTSVMIMLRGFFWLIFVLFGFQFNFL